MNVSVKGEGSETIVFLSGAGIASPILDFKNLTDSLSKKYKVVVVERGGMVLVKIVINQVVTVSLQGPVKLCPPSRSFGSLM